MKPVLPSWWKWLAVVFLGALLAGVFIWPAGKHDQAAVVDQQESPQPASPVTAPKPTKHLIGLNAGTITEDLSAELNTDSVKKMEERFDERTALAQSLQKESAEELLSRLETLWRGTEGGSRPSEEKALATIALTQALHSGDENSNAMAYQKLSTLLRDDGLPVAVRMEIAAILGSLQTPQSVQLLLTEYQQAADDKLRESLRNQITRTGDNLWAGRFREDLSPPLEAAWPLVKDDSRLAQAAAIGLAKVGTAAGVQLLINEVLRAGQTVEGLYDLNDAQGQAAFLALVKVRNPSAIAVLSTGLLNANSSEVNQYVCGLSLAAMGRGEATQVLLQWAVTATDREAAWAEQWFGKLRDTASFELVAVALSQTNAVAFNSATIRNAVVLGQRNRE